MIRRPPRSTQSRSSAASDVYKRQPIQAGIPGIGIRGIDLTVDRLLPVEEDGNPGVTGYREQSEGLLIGIDDNYHHGVCQICPVVAATTVAHQKEGKAGIGSLLTGL